MSVKLKPGQVWRIGPRYVGGGQYVHDNGTGEVVRLMRPMSDGVNWYVTKDLHGGENAEWDWMMHESRLERGVLLEDIAADPPT